MALAKEGFILGVRPVSSLLPHEETIPARVEKLASEVMRDGVQKDPVIIDRESATVLDGMHRLAAFTSLRIDNVVCCSVDYASTSVSLERWARVYTMAKGDSSEEAVRKFRLTMRATFADAFEALQGQDTGLAVLTSSSAYLPERKVSLGEAIEMIGDFDRLSEAKGWERRFVPEDDVDIPLQTEKNVVVLIRKLRKDDVVHAAKSGELFPCKTSMHLIDPRPVAVNFPLARLNSATSRTLQESLRGRGERLLPADSVYEGRRYKERLLLLNQ